VTGAGGEGLEIPEALAASHARYFGAGGRAWLAALPGVVAGYLDRWALRVDGASMCGAVALVLPVRCADGTAAVLKVQPVDEETYGEPLALRAWDGHGAVRLLRHDLDRGALLLERLDADRSLGTVEDDLAALRVLSEVLAGLTAVPAPPGIRRLADVGARLLDRAGRHLAGGLRPADRRLVEACAAAVADLLPEPGDRLLHWDLHYDNVLAVPPGSPARRRGRSWLAIDPKPLAGDPGFELLPALHNRWADVVATGDVDRAVRNRFDLMTDVLGLDRQRAAGWTLARVLAETLWELDRGEPDWSAEADRAIARVLLRPRRPRRP
jgi:streptomycin 6-kinase